MMFIILGLVKGGGFLVVLGVVVLVWVCCSIFELLLFVFFWLWLLWKFFLFCVRGEGGGEVLGEVLILFDGVGEFVCVIVWLDFIDFLEGGGEG